MRALKVLFFLAGVALLAVLIHETDTDALLARIRDSGWGFAGAFTAHMGFVAMGTSAWRLLLQVDRPVSWFRLYGAFWTGEAINYVFPAGAPGEIAKGVVLRGRAPAGELAESLAIYNLISGATIFGAIILCGVVAIFVPDIPSAVPIASMVTGTLLMLGLLGIRLLLRLEWLGRLLEWLTKLPLVDYDPASARDHVRSMDERLRAFRQGNRPRFVKCLLFLFGARVFETLEVYALMEGLMPGRGLGWLLTVAFLVYGASMVVLYVTIFVPGQIGTVESGTAGIFRLMGSSGTAGLALELLRRGRKLLSIAVVALVALVVRLTRGGARRGRSPADRAE
jgi:uncharacterized membrane protein YbhN (UPF0104 family)